MYSYFPLRTVKTLYCTELFQRRDKYTQYRKYRKYRKHSVQYRKNSVLCRGFPKRRRKYVQYRKYTVLYISEPFLYCTDFALCGENLYSTVFFLYVHDFSCTFQNPSCTVQFSPSVWTKSVQYRHFHVRTGKDLYILLFCPNNRFYELVVVHWTRVQINKLLPITLLMKNEVMNNQSPQSNTLYQNLTLTRDCIPYSL